MDRKAESRDRRRAKYAGEHRGPNTYFLERRVGPSKPFQFHGRMYWWDKHGCLRSVRRAEKKRRKP